MPGSLGKMTQDCGGSSPIKTGLVWLKWHGESPDLNLTKHLCEREGSEYLKQV